MSSSRYPKSIDEKLQLIETVLDGVVQHLEKGGDGKKYLGKLRKALGCARAIQVEYPQPNYSLLRFKNKDELPHEKHLWQKRFGRNRSLARSDWHGYKRRLIRRSLQKLTKFSNEEHESSGGP